MTFLRIVSYTIAWLALCISAWCGTLTVRTLYPDNANPALEVGMSAAPALWPFLFPEWFPEMARLGNDCLVVLLAALAMTVLLKLHRAGRTAVHCGALGLICGLGVLTKATFLPLVATITIVLAARLYHDDRRGQPRSIGVARFLAFLAALLLTGGWWYASKYLETGNVIGSNDIANASTGAGLLQGLVQNGSIGMFVKGWVGIVGSFAWSGTWSFARFPFVSLVPIFALIALLIAAHLFEQRKSTSFIAWLPLGTLSLFLIALTYHLCVFIAAYASAGTPGWYLHSMAPVFVPIIGTGLVVCRRSPPLRALLSALLLYAMIFLVLSESLLAAVYAGCVRKAAGLTGYALVRTDACSDGVPSLITNLSVLGRPVEAAALLTVGMITCIWGLRLLTRVRPAGA